MPTLTGETMIIYALALIFLIIPLNLLAYLNLKKGRIPLPKFQGNVVRSRVNARRPLGVISPIVFWVFHAWFALYEVDNVTSSPK